uniref:protein-tyrosine-phosphatase n=1 Tax=Arcella intermedia TaxID=1963864 RepID=A0A6B2L245_9EUKA
MWLGNLYAATDERMMLERGITHILAITGFGEMAKFLDEKKFVYKMIEVKEVEGVCNVLPFFDEAFTFIQSCLRDCGRIFVHCNQGRQRSATIVAAYLMRINKWKADEALSFIQSRRPVCQPHEAYLQQLKDYETTLSSFFSWAPEKDDKNTTLSDDHSSNEADKPDTRTRSGSSSIWRSRKPTKNQPPKFFRRDETTKTEAPTSPRPDEDPSSPQALLQQLDLQQKQLSQLQSQLDQQRKQNPPNDQIQQQFQLLNQLQFQLHQQQFQLQELLKKQEQEEHLEVEEEVGQDPEYLLKQLQRLNELDLSPEQKEELRKQVQQLLGPEGSGSGPGMWKMDPFLPFEDALRPRRGSLPVSFVPTVKGPPSPAPSPSRMENTSFSSVSPENSPRKVEERRRTEKWQQICRFYFAKANVSQSGLLEISETVTFWTKSGLPKDVLAKIWDLVAAGKRKLDLEQFHKALCLISLAQAGKEVSLQNITTSMDFPKFKGIDLPPELV